MDPIALIYESTAALTDIQKQKAKELEDDGFMFDMMSIKPRSAIFIKPINDNEAICIWLASNGELTEKNIEVLPSEVRQYNNWLEKKKLQDKYGSETGETLHNL